MVELHGGSISAHSDGIGKGATFVVTLPTISPCEEQSPQKQAMSPHTTCRILLVEDNADTTKVLSHLLRGKGHSVETATCIIEAMQLVQSRQFDLLISDLGLPDGSGTDLMQRVKAAGLPRGIALSGFGMEQDIQKSLEAGFSCHLTKPVDLPVLMTHIDQAMQA